MLLPLTAEGIDGMRDNDVRRALQRGDSAIGLMVFEFGTPGVGRMARAAGADFVLFDMEHSGFSPETVKALLDAARAAHITPFARVRDPRRSSVSQVLDLGAMGIMVPMVESEEQARQIVHFSKYPPHGRRGAAFGVAHDDYHDGDVVEKMRSSDEE